MSVAPDVFAAALDHRRAGRLEDAETACRQVLARAPGDVEALRLLGAVQLDLERPEQAEESLRKAVEIAPDDARAHHDLARALAEQEKLREAETSCRRALALLPDLVDAHVSLGKILHGLGRPVEAEYALRKALDLSPQDPEAHKAIGVVLSELGRAAEAVKSLERAVQFQPDDAKTRRVLAYTLMQLGRFADAEAQAREALRLKPHWVKAYSLLQVMEGFESGGADLAAIETLARERGDLSDDERIHLHFTLAKAHDGLGDFDRAFEFLSAANGLMRQSLTYDADVEERVVGRLATIFDEELFEHLAGSGYSSATPIFIVGMPRSGTTLLEQILSSHPDVYGAGELDAVFKVAGAVLVLNRDRVAFPEGVTQLERPDFEQLGRLYAGLVSRVAPTALRITDKMPANFHHLGLIHLMLPRARIIHCRRDPLDTCLSCYSTHFGGSLHWSYDLAEIGRYYRAYDRLMDHWLQVLPEGRVLDVRYEDVVGDFEREARRLVEHCGLPWSDACLAFHQNERPVHTASIAQVRRPLYASSVGRWRRYEQHLGPLVAALERPSPPADRAVSAE